MNVATMPDVAPDNPSIYERDRFNRPTVDLFYSNYTIGVVVIGYTGLSPADFGTIVACFITL